MIITRLVLLLACFVTVTASAEVVRIDVDSRTDVANGKSYGLAGPYERLAGRIYFEIDPMAEANQIIRDIQYAPTNADGHVEFSSDFYLLKPKDIDAGNGALFFEVSNRGGKAMLGLNFAARPLSREPLSETDMGDGFLLRNGFSLLWVGWQLDVPDVDDRLRVYAPVTMDDGGPIEGLVRSDFIVSERVRSHSLGDRIHIAYPVSDPDDPRNALTVRDRQFGGREIIPRSEWRFARDEGGRAVSDPGMVYLESGFEPGRIYEAVFVSENPRVAGTGLAAIRDTISHIKYDAADDLGMPEGAIDRAIAYGRSQSGRFLRTYLYDGFNADEQGQKVFDGVIPHVGGAKRGSFNHRFAQPSRANGAYFYPLGIFPFSDAVQTDPATGRRDGLLAGISAEAMPKVFHTNSSTEYWRASSALTHTTVDGTQDFAPVDNARIYVFSGTQHGPAPFPSPLDTAGRPTNSNDYTWFLRSLVLKLDAWIANDELPPDSRYPTIRDGSLVSLEEMQFPAIFDVEKPTEVSKEYLLDFGPRFLPEGIVANEPPEIGAAYPFLVPAVDESGNEIGGLGSPATEVPLGTYTGWSPDAPEGGTGLFLPFARTEAERIATGDSRPSIAERYPSQDHYLGLVTQAALSLIDDGYLLEEDLPAILERARQQWDYLMSADPPFLSRQ